MPVCVRLVRHLQQTDGPHIGLYTRGSYLHAQQLSWSRFVEERGWSVGWGALREVNLLRSQQTERSGWWVQRAVDWHSGCAYSSLLNVTRMAGHVQHVYFTATWSRYPGSLIMLLHSKQNLWERDKTSLFSFPFSSLVAFLPHLCGFPHSIHLPPTPPDQK